MNWNLKYAKECNNHSKCKNCGFCIIHEGTPVERVPAGIIKGRPPQWTHYNHYGTPSRFDRCHWNVHDKGTTIAEPITE